MFISYLKMKYFLNESNTSISSKNISLEIFSNIYQNYFVREHFLSTSLSMFLSSRRMSAFITFSSKQLKKIIARHYF